MKFSGHLAVGLVAINLLSVGAVGFADKTEEFLKKDDHQTEVGVEAQNGAPQPVYRQAAPYLESQPPATEYEPTPEHQH
jgi:hypothetical protein